MGSGPIDQVRYGTEGRSARLLRCPPHVVVLSSQHGSTVSVQIPEPIFRRFSNASLMLRTARLRMCSPQPSVLLCHPAPICPLRLKLT